MWKKISAITIFLLSLTSLIISSRLFFHYKFLADSYDISIIKLMGGDIWVLMELMNLCIVSIIFIIALVKCIAVLKNKKFSGNCKKLQKYNKKYQNVEKIGKKVYH